MGRMLPHLEFVYNRFVHSTTNCSPFEIVYGFNPLTPIDSLPMPNISIFKHKDARAKADYVKKLHQRVKAQTEKKNKNYAKQPNKGRKKIVFEPDDWVWVHMKKERFSEQRKSKLQQREDGHFQVLERINDNAYKVDLSGEYGVSVTFNVFDLFLFNIGNDSQHLRTNAFQEGDNDMDIQAQLHKTHDEKAQVYKIKSEVQDPIKDLGGPMTRGRLRNIQEALQCKVTHLLKAQLLKDNYME